MARIETKISKAQYSALLNRAMKQQPVEQQTSVSNQMAGMFSDEGPSLTPPMMPSPAAMSIPGMVPQPSGTQVPIAPVQTPIGDRIQQAEQSWMEIKGGLGEQLWNRLYTSTVDPGGAKTAASFFIQEATKYMADPANVKDERVRRFLESVVEPPPSGVTEEGTAQNPMTQLIAASLQ